RPHARTEVPAIPALACDREALRDALSRLRHPGQAAGGAGVGRPRRGEDRRLLRRDPLGPRRGGRTAGNRPRRVRPEPAVRRRAPGRRPRALLPPAQGHRARGRRVRAAPGRARDRRRAPPRRGSTPLRAGGHRRRSAERGLVRPVRDRGNGARQARRHVPARGGGRAHGGGVPGEGADRERDGGNARRAAAPARRGRGATARRRRGEPRVRRARPRPRCGRRPPAGHLRSDRMIASQVKRLGKHTAVYGLGGLVSRILAVLLLPLYTHYLGPRGFGKIETVVALTTVLVIVLRLGISSAFFRFYFDTKDEGQRTLVVRTSFWFTMTMATAGLIVGCALATPIAHALKLGDDPWLVRAAFVGLWAQMNYEQLTSLFRVEERSVSFVIASVANVLITVGATVLLVVGLDKGPTGAVVGNFVGTLSVYLVLLAYRRYQLGLELSRDLLREMNRFGMPLVPSALALWAINFIDRLFLAQYKGQAEVGVYSVAVRISSAIVFLMIAFRLAWPAFAYSIDDDREAKRTYSYVLTYLLFVCAWVSVALGLLAPWLVDWLARGPGFHRA